LAGTTKTPPREMTEINGEYNQLCAKIGSARYQIHRIDADIRSFLSRIQEVEVEASERSKLDLEAKNKATEETKTETPQESA